MKWVVCPRCEGNGQHTNPAIDGHGISAEEMNELGDDFREDYMSGVYDIRCSHCGGQRVVPGCPTEGCASALFTYDDGGSGTYFPHREQLAHCYEHLDADELERVKDWSEMAAESAMERRMGA